MTFWADVQGNPQEVAPNVACFLTVFTITVCDHHWRHHINILPHWLFANLCTDHTVDIGSYKIIYGSIKLSLNYFPKQGMDFGSKVWNLRHTLIPLSHWPHSAFDVSFQCWVLCFLACFWHCKHDDIWRANLLWEWTQSPIMNRFTRVKKKPFSHTTFGVKGILMWLKEHWYNDPAVVPLKTRCSKPSSNAIMFHVLSTIFSINKAIKINCCKSTQLEM